MDQDRIEVICWNNELNTSEKFYNEIPIYIGEYKKEFKDLFAVSSIIEDYVFIDLVNLKVSNLKISEENKKYWKQWIQFHPDNSFLIKKLKEILKYSENVDKIEIKQNELIIQYKINNN
jgi:hypothetical protein